MAPLPITHALIARDRHGKLYLMEAAIGETHERCVADLAEGQLSAALTLVRVERQDREACVVVDVTRAVLLEVAVYCEALELGAPENLHEAFAAAGVPPPQTVLTGRWSDQDADARLTAADLGLTTRRAA